MTGKLTNFPNGVASFGAPVLPGGVPATGGKVFWVGNRSGLPAGDGSTKDYPLSTMNAALAKCTSARGDIVIVLPGHAESINAADKWSSLVAGTKIIGLGTGNDRPIFTWTTATATVLLDVANVHLDNLILQMATDPSSTTATTVAAPITISAAGCSITRCRINMGVDADQIVTNGITTTAAGDDLLIADCEIHGAAAAELTSAIKLVGADRAKILRNKISVACATDTTGFILFATTASKDVLVADNFLHANGTGNKTCIDMSANLVNTGWLVRNFCRNMLDANAEWILTTGTGCDVQLMDNYGINNSNERGLAIGTASA